MTGMQTAADGATTRTERYVGADGTRLVGDVGGAPSAPTVIFLHGGGQTRHSWKNATETLITRGYHVINLDGRGHGDSDWSPAGDYRLSAFADDVARVIATLESAPVLVGASIGGATALTVVGTRPEVPVAGLVLVDIVPKLNVAGGDRIRDFMTSAPDGFASVEAAADAVAAYNPNRRRPVDAGGLMKNLRRMPDGRLRWHWDPKFLSEGDGNDAEALGERLNDAARNVRVPVLLVRGLHSDIVTDDGVADLKAQIPHLEVQGVAGAGHMIAGDRNDAFNAAIFAFLGRCLAAPLSTSSESQP